IAAEALHGRSREHLAKAGIVELRQVGEARRGELGPWREGGLPRALRELVPGTDGQAVVAAIDAVADGGAIGAGDRALMLDGEVGDAAAGIELVGRGKGGGRADVEAAPASPAMVLLRRIGWQLERGEDL